MLFRSDPTLRDGRGITFADIEHWAWSGFTCRNESEMIGFWFDMGVPISSAKSFNAGLQRRARGNAVNLEAIQRTYRTLVQLGVSPTVEIVWNWQDATAGEVADGHRRRCFLGKRVMSTAWGRRIFVKATWQRFIVALGNPRN